jgi:PIN domain nuclease of toxin-antitoxin system
VIVLDTHAFVWWASGNQEQLSSPALSAINGELDGGHLIVSSISCWELAMLVARDRISLSMDVTEWLKVVAQVEAVRFVPVDNDIAVKSVELPGDFHKDPADRIIVATARQLGVPVVSADDKIRQYSHVRSVW